jgi:membrane protease subunit HflC
MLKALTAALVVIAGLAGLAAYLAMFIVHVNEQAVVLTFGSPQQVINQPKGNYGPGLYFRIPFVQKVAYFDKRILDLDSPPHEVTAYDQKRLKVDSFARFRIVDPLLFYQSVGTEVIARDRLKTILESSLRRVLGNASFQDIVRDKREDLMKKIATQVNDEGKEFGLEVVDVRIKRADLPQQNQKNVFERMRAERQKEASEIRAEGTALSYKIRADADREVTVVKAEATKQSELLRGEGDADRNRIFAEAFGRDPDFFNFYRSMQAYDVGIKGGGADTRMILSPDSGDFFKYFNSPSGGSGSGPTKK